MFKQYYTIFVVRDQNTKNIIVLLWMLVKFFRFPYIMKMHDLFNNFIE